MDRARIERLEALLAKATPGPWFAEVSESDTCDWEVNAEEGKVAGEYGIESRDDAALMVAAVNALPALLRLARAVVDAPRVTAMHGESTYEYCDASAGTGFVMRTDKWAEVHTDELPADYAGQTVILLRADAADTTAGEG